MVKRKQKYLLPILALIGANATWGVYTVFIKMGVESIPPPIFISIRFLLVSLILLPFALRSWKPLSKKDFRLFILASVFNVTLSALTLSIGLSYTTAFNAAVINLMCPLILFVLSAQVLKERMRLTTLIGIFIALAGSIIIIGRPEAGNMGHLVGNLFVLVSVFFYACAVIISKPLMKKVSGSQAVFLSLFPGVIPVAIYSLTKLPTWDVSAVTSTSWYGLIGSIIGLLIANVLFYYALRYKRVQETGMYGYIDSTTSIIAAWFILGERASPGFILGAVLVFVGIYLAEVYRTKQQRLGKA